jgi:adenosylhomocysteine nucleosidase
MSMELKPVIKRTKAQSLSVSGARAFAGRRGDAVVFAAQAGVGTAAAGETTDRLLDQIEVDHVVVCGVAGGIVPTSVIGEVIVPDTLVEMSTGAELKPDPLGHLDPKGKVATVDELITDPGQLAGLVDDGVVAVEMESTGVARVCEKRGVPWSVVRSISDRPHDGLTDDGVMDLLKPDGSVDVLSAVRVMIARPSRIRRFMRLGRDASLAANRAADTTVGALG